LSGAVPPSDTERTLSIALGQRAGARILLVEDNEINRWVATEMLQDAGFLVQWAGNGQLALERLHADPPYDLVLMDVQMPVMDGLTATRALRQHAEWAKLPVVAMTANALPEDRERCLQAGMNDYVAKPIEPERLWQALVQWIAPQDTQPHRSAPAPAPLASADLAQGTLRALEGLQGLDAAKGLRMCMGKASLYLGLLSQFVQQEADAARRLDQALALRDGATAHRLAHSLKSVAGQLGAGPLQQVATQLEKHLKAHAQLLSDDALRTQLQPELDRLAQLLDTLIGGLRAALAPPTQAPASVVSPAAPAHTSRAAAEPICLQLERLLEAGDTAAQSWAAVHHHALQQVLGPRYSEMQQALDSFAFEEALLTLRQRQGPTSATLAP
jgi:CheY-like chemotaxis protein